MGRYRTGVLPVVPKGVIMNVRWVTSLTLKHANSFLTIFSHLSCTGKWLLPSTKRKSFSQLKMIMQILNPTMIWEINSSSFAPPHIYFCCCLLDVVKMLWWDQKVDASDEMLFCADLSSSCSAFALMRMSAASYFVLTWRLCWRYMLDQFTLCKSDLT